MADPITKTDLTNAKLDADSLAKFVNGAKEEVVATRTGATYPTSANIVANIATHVLEGVTISSNVFGSTASGLAGTVNLQYFTVVSSDPNEYIILYQNVAGVATEKKRYPSLALVQKIFEIVDDFSSAETNTAFSFQDGLGFVMLKFLVDGAIDMINGKIERTDYNGLELGDENGFLYAYFGVQNSMINGMPLALDQAFQGIEWQDESGFITAKITETGSYFGRDSSALTSEKIVDLNGQKRTDIMAAISYGQSLSRGSSSVPVISVTQPYSNVMLGGGILARPKDAQYDASGFIPMVAAAVGSEGETPINGVCNGIVKRLVEEDGELAANWVFQGMAPGVGGRSVAALSPYPLGTEGTYEGMIQAVRDSYNLAHASGKSYSVWGTVWAQGENDNSSGTATSRNTYAEQLTDLIDAMARDFVSVTGQQNRPYFFTYQMNANRRYSQTNMRIALALLSLARIRPDVVMFAPNYIFQRAGDNLHLSAEGSWLMGEYAARAMKYTMVSRQDKWRPLEPISVDWQDNHIDIKYHVPHGKIVIDTALVNQALNQGFDLWVSRDTPLNLVTTVVATAFDTVRVNLSAPAPINAFLSYASGRAGDTSGPLSGACGNVRDTHGDFDTVTSPGGNTYNMHNPSVAFEYNRKTGF